MVPVVVDLEAGSVSFQKVGSRSAMGWWVASDADGLCRQVRYLNVYW
jgi:hypothetical protein